MHSHIHYEAAFEDFLRTWGVPYVAVDEAHRATLSDSNIKSFDFLVYPAESVPWVVDVKGRKFPYEGADGGKRYWENWVTRDDLAGLAAWGAVFRDSFEQRFVFAYWLIGPPERWPEVRPHTFLDNHYVFYSVKREDYAARCRNRSDSWQTVSVPSAVFREIATPLEASP